MPASRMFGPFAPLPSMPWQFAQVPSNRALPAAMLSGVVLGRGPWAAGGPPNCAVAEGAMSKIPSAMPGTAPHNQRVTFIETPPTLILTVCFTSSLHENLSPDCFSRRSS